MSNFTVLRVKAMKNDDIGKCHTHNFKRDESNIDSKKSHLNQCLVGTMDIKHDAEVALKKYPLASKRTTYIAAEFILSASPEFFDSISPNWRNGKYSTKFEDWKKANMDWLMDKYGDGLVSLNLHLDEQTPHFHALIVPVCTYEMRNQYGTKPVTKINFRRVFSDTFSVIKQARLESNRDVATKMGRLQTEYAKQMQQFGLVRGNKNSRAKHSEIRDFQKIVKTPAPKVSQEFGYSDELEPVPKLMDRSESNLVDWNKRNCQIAYESGISATVNFNAAITAKGYFLDDSRNKNDALELENRKLKNDLAKKARLIKREEVALMLGYKGDYYFNGKQAKNSIDLLMWLKKISYEQAIRWLVDKFNVGCAVYTSGIKVINESDYYDAMPIPSLEVSRKSVSIRQIELPAAASTSAAQTQKKEPAIDNFIR